MIEAYSAAEIIAAKRDHHSLTDPQIDSIMGKIQADLESELNAKLR